MSLEPTNDLCANFGHNFYRKRSVNKKNEEIRCKHCNISIALNKEGDFDLPSKQNHAVDRLIKQLFIIKSKIHLKKRHRIYHFPQGI
ncbi:MAG: hypothetical protein KJO41_01530 [Bacteroidia bacterium]|nr:hypothetical protein [Bacteroidia bacterium]NND25211.1 hypothetical protein [Flavobacteriaceae bacterium]MBT8277653.1 hypothetical protein [Bacteroidia bacterium]NNK60924.1 hypothetical protein [Flavobacteriaceae bacterium]NNL31919.1 hypothetical protein [Flavobacteriaceae bacterium]